MAKQKQNAVVESEPVGPEAPKAPVPDEIQGQIEKLKADHNAAMVAAEEKFKGALADLVLQHRAAAEAQARAVDAGVQERLKAATAAALAAGADEASTSLELAAERDLQPIQAQVDGAVKSAKQALAEIDTIMEAHGPEIDRLGAVKVEDWQRGLPTQGVDAVPAFNLARSIPKQIEELTNFVRLVHGQFETNKRELERAVQDAPVPFGHRNTDRFFSWRQWVNGALRDLGRVNADTVAHVKSRIHELLGAVSEINRLREKYRGTPESAKPFETEVSWGRTTEQREKMARREGIGLPVQADISYSPYGR